MAPRGTVRSSGPSLKVGYSFVRPRISMAFVLMLFCSFFLHYITGEVENFRWFETGLCGFAKSIAQQTLGGIQFCFATAIAPLFGNKGAQSLTAVDNAGAFQFLVRALDRDDADQQIFRECPEGGQRRAGLETSF